MDKKTNQHSVYISAENDCLFPKQFSSLKESNWNKELPIYFKRLNKIDDDRSFVILATSVLEYRLDLFLKEFIPKYSALIDDKTSFYQKIRILRAFNLIPKQFSNMFDIMRNIRNDFAHNLDIDSFGDSENSEKLPQHLDSLKKIWDKFDNDMCYWSKDKPIRLMFKDIWRVSLEGLWVYESNIRLFRQETENIKFITHLDELSKKLRS